MAIEPYGVVGLIPTFWGVKTRDEIDHNIDHLKSLTKASIWLSNLDIPVRLLALPEGALQGFNDEVMGLDHVDYARACAIDLPGPETDRLGEIAKTFDVFIMAHAKARHPDWPDRYFSVGFIVSPDGEIVLKHYKLNPLIASEWAITPHDIYDWWIEQYGNTLDAFFPVADTAIGRLGMMLATEGCWPENARGLMMNGAEVVYRGALPGPFTQNDMFEITNRARALENNVYVVAPNVGGYYLNIGDDTPIDAGSGRSMIIDYRGQITGKQLDTNGSTRVTGTINIEALRHHRAKAQVSNWAKDIRAEIAQLIYANPVFPKNRFMDMVPGSAADDRPALIAGRIEDMQSRGIWKEPEIG